jgi:prevent-host-death family protein
MEEIAISKFKATCLSVLDRVSKTKKPILVTKFGKPVAQVVPPPIPERQRIGLDQ